MTPLLALVLSALPAFVVARRGWRIRAIIRLASRYCHVHDLVAIAPLAGGAVAACLWGHHASAAGFAAALFILALALLAWLDYRTFLLPDILTLPLQWAGLAAAGVGITSQNLDGAVLGLSLGFGLPWLMTWCHQQIRGVRGMGNGDFKLLGAIGAWIGATALPAVVLIAVAVSLMAQWLRGQLHLQATVPFGPGLVVGAVLVQILGSFGFAVEGFAAQGPIRDFVCGAYHED